jgi:hypothetical protein
MEIENNLYKNSFTLSLVIENNLYITIKCVSNTWNSNVKSPTSDVRCPEHEFISRGNHHLTMVELSPTPKI